MSPRPPLQGSTSEVISFTSLFIGRRAPLEATLCSHGWAQTITDPSSLYVLEGSHNLWLGLPVPSMRTTYCLKTKEIYVKIINTKKSHNHEKVEENELILLKDDFEQIVYSCKIMSQKRDTKGAFYQEVFRVVWCCEHCFWLRWGEDWPVFFFEKLLVFPLQLIM